MKALLPVGIVLIVIGLGGGFAYQVAVALSTGLPTSGIGWMQAAGFVTAALGAILIGAYIGRRRTAARRKADQERERRWP